MLRIRRGRDDDDPAGRPADMIDNPPKLSGWPDHACVGCSMVADQVTHLAHRHARNTTLAFASRAPQPDIARLKARIGWTMPWYTITDDFDADLGSDE